MEMMAWWSPVASAVATAPSVKVTDAQGNAVSGVSVTSPSGAPTDIAISDFGAYRQIRIGSPSQTITGTADYVVTYRLEHIVNDIGDGTAEFYYDLVDTSNLQRQILHGEGWIGRPKLESAAARLREVAGS